jgi:hypothetical protein
MRLIHGRDVDALERKETGPSRGAGFEIGGVLVPIVVREVRGREGGMGGDHDPVGQRDPPHLDRLQQLHTIAG